MKKSRSILSEMVILIGCPVILIILAMAFACVVGLNQSQLVEAETSLVKSEILIIFGLGLSVIGGFLYYAFKKISKSITMIQRVTQQLADGDTSMDVIVKTCGSKNQLDEINNNCIIIAEQLDRQALMAKDLAEGRISDMEVFDSDTITKDSIEKFLNQILESEQRVQMGIEKILEETSRGCFSNTVEISEFTGSRKKLMETINQIVANAADKIFWYESVLDAIPYPIHVLDLNGVELHMNTALEESFAAAGLFPDRVSAYGHKSCEANIEICNSEECPEDCSVRRLMGEGISETDFIFDGNYGKMNTAYVMNRAGEKIGIAEISADVTSTMSVNAFAKKELNRLEKNLFCLAEGNLDFEMEISEGNAYTSEVYDLFQAIDKSLEAVKKSVGSLIEDGTMLTESVLKGDLEAKADEEQFNGSWKSLIGGMNRMMAVITKPVQEVSGVMDSISRGNLNQFVSGTYEGEFDKLKQAVNNTTTNLKRVMVEITDVTGQIGKGNLNIPVISDFQGDYSEISRALNQIIKTLNTLLGDVNMAAAQVAIGSNQVSDSSQSLAQGSSEQASSIQELTAAIIEISDQTKNNAISANTAKEQTLLVRELAENGNHKMLDMQQSMMKINQSSKEISKIIKVIDEIAFQTNILALNAAVEAARAGQHGKGFAVVAEEVRSLAARSAEAAKETTLLIEGSIDNVEVGSKISDETASALTEIVDEINKVTVLMGNIAEASSEQATGIAQINVGVEMVGQVVQQNSATAEQTAAASEELSGQAAVLQEMIGQFELRVI